MILEDIIGPLLVAIVSTIISGWFLLHIHHSRVKQEIRLHIEKEEMTTKRETYRKILSIMNWLTNYSNGWSDELNWRAVQTVYSDLILVGSPDIMELINKFLRDFESMSEKDATSLIREIWSKMRRDLWKESALPPSAELKFVTPGKKTREAIKFWFKNREKLQKVGISNLSNLKEMDPIDISRKTGIRVPDLERLKKMAEYELHLEETKNLPL